MPTLDEYASLLAGLKQSYKSATDKAGRDKVTADGTALRQKAFADKIDLTQLDDAAMKLSGGSTASAGAQKLYRQNNIGMAHTAIAKSNVDAMPNMGVAGGGSLQYTNDYLEKAGTYQTMLEKMMADGFKYDYNTDNAYIALKGQVEAGAAEAKQNSMETMNDRGILNSSVTESAIRKTDQMAQNTLTSAIPGMEANAYNKYHQGISDLYNMMTSTYNMGSGDRQFTYDRADANAAYDGTYEDPQAMALINGIMGLKQQASAKGITADQRAVFSKEADMMRAQLASLGYDANKLFGSGVKLEDAMKNSSLPGPKTLQYQQMEHGMLMDKENLKINQANSKKSSGGGGGGGLTPYQQLGMAQDEATNRWIGDLMASSDRQDAISYITQYRDQIIGDKVSLDSLYDWINTNFPADGKGGGSGGTPTPTEMMDVRNKALAAAQDDPGYAGMSAVQRNQLIQAWIDFLSGKTSSSPYDTGGSLKDPTKRASGFVTLE